MKILFDSQIFDWQINGGISRYFIEVLQRLDKSPEVNVLFRVKHSYNTYIQDTVWLQNRAFLKNINFKGKLGLLKQINQRLNRPYSDRILRKGATDLYHTTYYDPYFVRHLGKTPLVLTVYDLTNEKFNDQSPLTQKVLGWKKELISKAAHIISISENTRKDIIEIYGVAPEKITTVYLSGGFSPNVRQLPLLPEMKSIPERFVLFVGSRSAYKNFNSFIKEAAPVLIQESCHLVVVGGGQMTSAEQENIRQLGITDRVIAYPHIDDVFLSQLYRRATVFVFPSLYEGFGIPVLEAQQCGCPALLSNYSSLPEVGGEAARYFNPFEEGSLRKELSALLQDETVRQKMREAGPLQAARFNWDITARQHIEVYKQILS